MEAFVYGFIIFSAMIELIATFYHKQKGNVQEATFHAAMAVVLLSVLKL